MKNNEGIKELVREKCTEIVNQFSGASYCCGGESSCCSDYSTFSDDYTKLAG